MKEGKKMKGKCLECNNYYPPWRFCCHVEAHKSDSSLLRLNTEGHENELLKCNHFEPKLIEKIREKAGLKWRESKREVKE